MSEDKGMAEDRKIAEVEVDRGTVCCLIVCGVPIGGKPMSYLPKLNKQADAINAAFNSAVSQRDERIKEQDEEWKEVSLRWKADFDLRVKVEDERDMLRVKVKEMKDALESGFMKGAYARLKNLQDAERERDALKGRVKELMSECEMWAGKLKEEEEAHRKDLEKGKSAVEKAKKDSFEKAREMAAKASCHKCREGYVPILRKGNWAHKEDLAGKDMWILCASIHIRALRYEGEG